MLTTHIDSLETLVTELQAHPVNSNDFFRAFQDSYLSPRQMRVFVKQYHYFCFQFVKVLEGLLYRTPIDELEMRIELAKILYSELGSGSVEHVHIGYLQRFAYSIGIQSRDLFDTEPIVEVTTYLNSLRRLFLESDYLTALDAELAVEMTAASEFRYFLPGLKKYGHFSQEDLVFFELHVLEEQTHSSWLVDAVRKTVKTPEDLDRVAAGAMETADAWLAFWDGMYRPVFETDPIRQTR